MTEYALPEIRSFRLDICGGDLKPLVHFLLPLSVIAPLGNRIFREVIPEKRLYLTEPWYYVMENPSDRAPLKRADYPAGPTSLYATRYFPENEPLPRVKLHPDAPVSGFWFFIKDLDRVLFQGAYTTDDIFLAAAEHLARRWIEKGGMSMKEGPFYYTAETSRYSAKTIPEDLFPPEAYDVEGVFRLPRLPAARKRIKFKKIVPAPFPVRDPAEYGETRAKGKGEPVSGKIFMHADVYQALKSGIELSRDAETGGFLVGRPFRLPDSAENEDDPQFRWLVEITDTVQAEGAWGKPLALLFTGDTWSRMRKQIDVSFPEKDLVAWFHTHLFAATDDFGLSGWDQDLHRRFLTRPWQVAVLVNMDRDGNREVRRFQRGAEGDLAECRFEVFGQEAKEETRGR